MVKAKAKFCRRFTGVWVSKIGKFYSKQQTVKIKIGAGFDCGCFYNVLRVCSRWLRLIIPLPEIQAIETREIPESFIPIIVENYEALLENAKLRAEQEIEDNKTASYKKYLGAE